jgi:hypothetical protein
MCFLLVIVKFISFTYRVSELDSKYTDSICFKALFSKASTLVDGSWRVSFDVNITEISEIVKLAKLLGDNLQIAVIPIPKDKYRG